MAIVSYRKVELDKVSTFEGMCFNDFSNCLNFYLLKKCQLSVELWAILPKLLRVLFRNENSFYVINVKLYITNDAPLSFKVIVVWMIVRIQVVEKFKVAKYVEVQKTL